MTDQSDSHRHLKDAIFSHSIVSGAYLLALAMALVVGTALGFEHIGGYIPCALCLEQRTPYYLGIALAILAAIMASAERAAMARLVMLACGGLMLYGAGLGAYHAGVEWGFWPGPATCATGSTTGIATDAQSLLDSLNTLRPPSCDQAALRFAGLSFAGWNVITSMLLAAFAFWCAAKAPPRRVSARHMP